MTEISQKPMFALAAADNDLVNKIVKDTLEYMKKHGPKDYAKLESSPSDKACVVKEITSVANEQVFLAKKLKSQPDNVEEILRKHLPEDRIKLLKGGLEIPTFRLDLKKHMDDGKYVAEFSKNNQSIMEPRFLVTSVSVDWATVRQMASIVVEGVMLVMAAVGLSPGSSAIEQGVDEAAHVLQSSSAFRLAVEEFVEKWNSAGGSSWDKAKALFFLVQNTYSAGVLWTIIKAICSNMSWLQWVKTSAIVTAMIVASLLTDGAALIAKIALIVMSAYDFAKKIINLSHLDRIKSEISD